MEDNLLKERDLPLPSLYDRTHSDWLIMLPYMLLLLSAFALAWAERLEHSNNSTGLPRVIPTLWRHRQTAILIIAGAALLLLVLELMRGFGLERALEAAVSEKFEPKRAAATSPGEQGRIDFLQQQELAKYGLERTGWLCLVLCCHVLAVLAIFGRFGLERRGSKPPPRIVIQY